MTKKKEAAKSTGRDELSKFLNDHWQSLIGVLVAGGIVWGGVLAYNTWEDAKEVEAQEELFALRKQLEEKQNEVLKAETEAQENNKKKTSEKPERTPETLQSNYSDLVTKFRDFVAANKGRNAAAMAAIEMAGLASSHKDFKLATDLLIEVEPSLSAGGLFFGLVHSQLGTVLMEQGEYQEALKHFDRILEVPELGYAHSEALLRKAACHMELKQWDLAESALVKIESEAAASQATMTAKGLKRLLMLRKAEG